MDEGDPWAASTAPQLQSQLESAGFTVTLVPAASAAAAGALLSDGVGRPGAHPPHDVALPEPEPWPGTRTCSGPPGQNGSQNWTNYDNDTFNSLVTKALAAAEPAPDRAGLPDGRHAAVGGHASLSRSSPSRRL